MERAIVHMDLDCFFVSVERLRNSQLNNKPVIVGGMSDRGVVSACSYEARRFGIHSAMPMRMARHLCPEAIIVRGDYESYSQYSDMVTEVIVSNAPLVEKASVDEFYLDMTGMEKFFGTFSYAQKLRKTIIKETGLSISFGLSTNKTVSKVITNEVKPANFDLVHIGAEKGYLAPLNINKLPMVGEVTAQTLRNMGISKVGTLGEMPFKVLERTFGKMGKVLWEKANGIDFTPVIPYSEPKSMSKEVTFQQDTTDIIYLRSVIIRLTEQLSYELRQEGYCTACVTVKLRYSNFDTHSKQIVIASTSADHILIPLILQLFEQLYEKRLLIRLVGVRFTKLVRGVQQLSLFDQSAKIAPLYTAMDNIRSRYGIKAVGRAMGQSPKRE
ncbi:DNA polymerase IV [Flectobacillus roseus]|uniref:DNA polymerase IV n=1 Tax=Flectobacillus roseus TaxID=502259 RepID=UPI0024B7898F|nr:DNA polymerase IV [Flectobacillus roseus]MDI9871069.1 DNA polymerase IV [Flectobacillus roseus]